MRKISENQEVKTVTGTSKRSNLESHISSKENNTALPSYTRRIQHTINTDKCKGRGNFCFDDLVNLNEQKRVPVL